jgi:hypothetical protein
MLEKVLNKGKKYFIFDSLSKVSDDTCLDNECKLIDFDETKKIVIEEAHQSSRSSCDGLHLNDNINFIEFKSFKKVKEQQHTEDLERKERRFVSKVKTSLLDKIESSIWIFEFVVHHKDIALTKNDKITYSKLDKNYYLVVDIDLTKPNKDSLVAQLNGLTIPTSLYNNLIIEVKNILDGIEQKIKIKKPLLIDCKQLKEILRGKNE